MFVALAHGEEVSVRELQSGDWERLQFGALARNSVVEFSDPGDDEKMFGPKSYPTPEP
jgi:hypothetical protein